MALEFETPASSLLSELEEVAENAESLRETVLNANGLPREFPSEAVIDMCFALEALVSGTAEGCRIPLEYARARLPAIRRAHILKDDDTLNSDDDEIPPLTRGMSLDIEFQKLIASITTCLDEYRLLASITDDDHISVDPEYDTNNVDKSAVITDSVVIGSELSSKIDTLSDKLNLERNNAANLLRELNDAETLNKLARSETKQRRIIVRWLRVISNKMIDLPSALRATASFIEVTHDIAVPARKYWSETRSQIVDFMLNRYRRLAEAFRETADVIDEKYKNQNFNASFSEKDADIRSGFEHWVYRFIQERSGAKDYVDASLFYPEVKHLTDMTSSSFAKRKGSASFKELLKKLRCVKIEDSGNSYSVRIIKGQAQTKILREWRDAIVHRLLYHSMLTYRSEAGKVFSFDSILPKYSKAFVDELISYLKLSKTKTHQLLDKTQGLKLVSKDAGGQWEITDRKIFLRSIYPRYLWGILDVKD